MNRINQLAKAGLISLTAGLIGLSYAAEPVKIGFVVKQPEEPWFQQEWRFAEKAGQDLGFEVVKIGAADGDKVLNAINSLKAQKAQGMVICVPDVKLGPGVVNAAKAANIKLFTVDDRLLGGNGKPIESVPHMGIDAKNIGGQVGDTIAAEAKKRGWNFDEVGAIRISYNSLPTAKDRTDGATEALLKAGFKEGNIFESPQAKTDTENAFNAATITITQHPQIKKWVAFGLNDEAVLGAVRATEGRGFSADDVIGVGIGGQQSAINEFVKAKPTGFFAAVLLSPKAHGYDTAKYVYNWVSKGEMPPMLTYTKGFVIKRDDYKEVMKEAGVE